MKQFRTGAGESKHGLVRVADGEQFGVNGVIEAQGSDEAVEAGRKVLILVDVEARVSQR